MTTEDRRLVREHIRHLEWLALECPDEERRTDAVKTLAAMVLLTGGDDPPDKGGGEVIYVAFRSAA